VLSLLFASSRISSGSSAMTIGCRPERSIVQVVSPDELTELVLHIFPNLYSKGAARDHDVAPADVTEGMVINQITVSGAPVDTSPESAAVRVEHTMMTIVLEQPLGSGASLEMSLSRQCTHGGRPEAYADTDRGQGALEGGRAACCRRVQLKW
jgi:hypothetical protein